MVQLNKSTRSITVYLLNFNYSEYLRSALDSLVAQTDNDFQVILVDNGSTDCSLEILEQYSNKYGWPLLQFENITLGSVGNYILERCNTDYVTRLDADDWFHESYIELMKEKAAESHADLIYGNYFYVDGLGVTIGQHECLERLDENQGRLHDEPLHGACTLIKVSTFKKLGGYYEDNRCQDGFDLYLKMRNSKFSQIETPCFFYRKGHNSLSSKKSRLYEARIKLIERRFLDEAISEPKVLYVLICDSKAKTSFETKEKILTFANEISNRSNNSSICLVAGLNDSKQDWEGLENIALDFWSENESKSVSSKELIRRVVSGYSSDFVSLVNVGDKVAPIDYILQMVNLSRLLLTDGSITGYRFDQSLFKPVFGGVSQVVNNGAIKDVDRWVVHIGGITCLKRDVNFLERSSVYSLMEVDPEDLITFRE